VWVWEAKTSPKFPGGFSATSHIALVLPPETVAFDDMHPNGQVGIAMLELNCHIYMGYPLRMIVMYMGYPYLLTS